MTYKVGIIGTGFGLKVHLPSFQAHPDFEVLSIAGRNLEKTKKIAEEANIEYTTNWKDFLTNKDIDIIAVTTPPYHHFKMAKKVLKYGKHLLLEKPTTTNASEARRLCTFADDAGLIGMMAHEFRWLPERMMLSSIVQSGKIGEILNISSNYYYNFSSSPYGWLWNSLFHGGILGAGGSHLIDMIRSLTGFEIVDVSGRIFTNQKFRLDRKGNKQKATADDGFFSDFTLENGAVGHLNASATIKSPPTSRVIISGTEGTVMLDGDLVYLTKDDNLEKVEIDPKFILNKPEEKDRRLPPFMKLLDQLSKSLNDGISYTPNLFDGFKNQQFLDAVRLSNQTNSRITITDYL